MSHAQRAHKLTKMVAISHLLAVQRWQTYYSDWAARSIVITGSIGRRHKFKEMREIVYVVWLDKNQRVTQLIAIYPQNASFVFSFLIRLLGWSISNQLKIALPFGYSPFPGQPPFNRKLLPMIRSHSVPIQIPKLPQRMLIIDDAIHP